jgi:hypothetical protein
VVKASIDYGVTARSMNVAEMVGMAIVCCKVVQLPQLDAHVN